jgi:hypothetical protein
MIKTALAAIAATAVLLAPTSPAAAGTVPERGGAAITGTWKGSVHGDEGGPASYPAKVKITKKDGRYHGKITYPGACKGKWNFRGKKGGWFTFREIISSGPCVSPVSAKVKRVGAKLKVVWREPQTGDQGFMRAHRI